MRGRVERWRRVWEIERDGKVYVACVIHVQCIFLAANMVLELWHGLISHGEFV